MAPRRLKVYLAGPITNCSDTQIHGWREEAKSHWGDEFDFVDPTGHHDEPASPFEVATRDLYAIHACDALLVYMWKESIGTAIGVAHAVRHGKPIFVVDPNLIQSQMLAFYANSVSRTMKEAIRHLREHVRAEERLKTVVKRGGEEEPFDRRKLLETVRRACRSAGVDDLLAPAQIVPEVVSRLMQMKRTPGKGKLTTTAIREAVWEVLAVLEADPLRAHMFAGVRGAWEGGETPPEEPAPPRRLDPIVIHDRPMRVRVFCGKSHTSIWGVNVKDVSQIPKEPRRFFEEVCRVDGIQEIRLTTMASSRSVPADAVRGEVFASRDEGIIEGKCYDRAVSGRVQSFQVRVHDPERTEVIRVRLIAHLHEKKLLRTPLAETE